jgi:hypothetical protein
MNPGDVMSIFSATTQRRSTRESLGDVDRRAVLRWLYPALAIGAVWGVALTVLMLGFTTTDDGHPYKHTADYWLVGLGIPLAISATVVVQAIHALAVGRDGRRGQWGAAVFTVPMVVFTAIFIDGLAQGESSSWGPTYLLCVLVGVVSLGFLVAGLWRSGVLPRSVLALWFVGWLIGGPLCPPAGSLLLSAAYVVLAVQMRKQHA